MITKDMLREYAALGMELKTVERQLEELENEVYIVRGVVLSLAGAKNRRPSAGADFTALVAKLLDLKEHYARKWDALIDARMEIEREIEELPSELRAIIRAKYIGGLTWDETAEEIGYSARQVHRIMRAAGF